MSKDFTEDEIIFAYQQIGLGRDAADVFTEITGSSEHAELGAINLLDHIRIWYMKQTLPEMVVRLTEAINALDEIDDDFSRQEIYERNKYVMEIVNDVRNDLKVINAALRRVTVREAQGTTRS